MKNAMLVALFLLLIAFSGIQAQTNDGDQAYIKAMTANSPAQRAQLLKEYIAKYGGKGNQYENYAYANLCLLPYQGKTNKETLEFGEKALSLGGLDDLYKCQILLVVSGTYSRIGQNLEKAKDYSSQVIEIARANRGKEAETSNPDQWNQLLGAGYFSQGQAQEKAKDNKGAVDSYINSYNILKNPKIIHSLRKVGKALYEYRMYADAEKAFKFSYQTTKDSESLALYANSLYRAGKQEEALSLFKEAYGKSKSGEMAYNIGIILARKAKENPALSSEAIRYLLDASFLYPAKSQQAMSLAENLFYSSDKNWNDRVKEIQERNKKIEELVNTFNSKFEGKSEDDLNDTEKKEVKAIQDRIEAEKKALQKLEAEQKAKIDAFNKLFQETKQKLGIK
ncbi:MAG: hypothetical protein WCC06_05690 [Candidatus Aminicenantales bacterium]